LAGKRREMGLGPFPTVNLAAARLLASGARGLATAGQEPIAVRKAEQARQQLEAARGILFEEAAEQIEKAHEGT
jgi:hypothetical protein